MNAEAVSDIKYQESIGRAGIAVKDGVVSSLKGINEI